MAIKRLAPLLAPLLLLILAALLLTGKASAQKPRAELTATTAEYFVAIPLIRVILHTNTLGTDTLVWCNAELLVSGEEYTGTGQLQPVRPSGIVDCEFPYDFLNQEHVAGTVHVWTSSTYLGDPFVLETSDVAEGWISYP